MGNLAEPPIEEFDEHDSPTEPMSAIILSPYSVASPSRGGGNGTGRYGVSPIPVPQPPEVAFPRNGQPVVPAVSLPETRGVYPVLPAAPHKRGNGRPPGGAGSAGLKVGAVKAQPRQSSIPSFVGVLFVVAQLILLVRVVLSLFGVPVTTILVELVYDGATVLAWPLRLLLGQLPLPAQLGGDLIGYAAALIAILVYGVLGRVLVRFLKALLNSR